MPIIESTSLRLVLKSGSTTLSFDRDSGQATLKRKILFWSPKPIEAAMTDIKDVKVDVAVDRASGVELYSTVMVFESGPAWAFPSNGKADAESNVDAIRQFLDQDAGPQ
jgi:hypothetical protein